MTNRLAGVVLAMVVIAWPVAAQSTLVVIKRALDDKSRRAQARGYLAELGAPVP